MFPVHEKLENRFEQNTRTNSKNTHLYSQNSNLKRNSKSCHNLRLERKNEKRYIFQYLSNKKMRPPTNTFREVLKVTASGTCTVLLSTAFSCILAAGVETAAHRIQYKFFPHWYDGKVKYAMGLPHLQYQKLDSEVQQEEIRMSAFTTSIKVNGQEEYSSFEKFSTNDSRVSLLKEEKRLSEDHSQSIFANYKEKMQEKVMLLSPERASKILCTTAMCG